MSRRSPLTAIFKLVARALLTVILTSGLALPQAANTSVEAIKSLIRSKDYDQALLRTRSALRQKPGDYPLWTIEGVVLSITQHRPEALKAFDKALSLAPTYTPALQGKAELLYQAQDDRAIPVFEKLLKANPSDQTAYEMYAVLQARRGECPSSIAHFRRSEKVIANHPSSLEAYGDCLAQTKQSHKAIAVFNQLIALVPKETYPKYDLAVLLIETKQYDEAIKILEPLLSPDQTDPDIFSLASEAYEALGDTPRAVALLHQAIVQRPSTARYYTAFALLCFDHESFQVGIDMINAGLQRISDDASLYLSRGLLYAQLAQYEKAEADFRMAQSLDSEQALSSYAIDLAQLEKHQPERALSKVRSQLKEHPESALHHYLLASLLERNSSDNRTRAIKEAMESALEAVKLKPDFVQARDLLASLYQQSGQYALAIQQCRLVLRYAPSDHSALYHLIILLRHSDNREDRNQVQVLVKRLSEAQQASLQKDTNRKRFKFTEVRSAERLPSS